MSSIIRKIMHKIGFLGHPMGASAAIYALYLKFLTKRILVAGLKQRISISEPLFGWGA